MDLKKWYSKSLTRRQALKNLGGLTGAGFLIGTGAFDIHQTLATRAGLAATPTISPTATGTGDATSIQHVLIACQENRSFDTYFGMNPKAGNYGIPPSYTQPDGKGGTVAPQHAAQPTSTDISHTWSSIHKEWNNGASDGFVTTDGNGTMIYYDGSDLPYYYALADNFTLCGNYFCSLLGPTDPNRLYLWTATSGGNTSNSISHGSLNWSTIVDLLDAQQITWKCYNIGLGSTTNSLEVFNTLILFSKWQNDPRIKFTENDYYNDLKAGMLPQVSFIITEGNVSEHPPQSIQLGQQKMAQVTNALIASSAWTSSALFFTYDEGGGFFEHVTPPQVDAYGLGFRVPMLLISPYAKRGYVSGQLYEHSSVLTRDGLSQLGDFYEAFDFTQDPNYYPVLPPV